MNLADNAVTIQYELDATDASPPNVTTPAQVGNTIGMANCFTPEFALWMGEMDIDVTNSSVNSRNITVILTITDDSGETTLKTTTITCAGNFNGVKTYSLSHFITSPTLDGLNSFKLKIGREADLTLNSTTGTFTVIRFRR
jgi:hypothetical protein